MKVWIFQTGEPLHIDEGALKPMRAMNLANLLIEHRHSVTIWSSTFFHQMKKHRANRYVSIKLNNQLTIKLVPSSGYTKNISLRRLIDHKQLGTNLKDALARTPLEELPDIAYVGFPPIEFANVAGSFLKKLDIPYVVDAKDMWPDYFVEKFPAPFQSFASLLFSEWYRQTISLFKDAEAFSTISDSYLSWMCRLAERKPNQFDLIAPTTSPPVLEPLKYKRDEQLKWYEKSVDLKERKIIFYAGTLNKTVLLAPLLDAFKKLQVIDNSLLFVICGDGPTRNTLQKKAKHLENVIFTGWISNEMVSILAKNSLASLIPYKNSASITSGIPNKFSDALSNGTPVITCLKGDVKKIINMYKVGFYYDEASPESFLDIIKRYLLSPNLHKTHSKNAKKLYDEKLSYQLVYGSLHTMLERIAKNKYG